MDKRARYIVGVMIGIAGAFGLTRFLASFLFDVKARDPLAFLVTPLLLLVALLAVWIPARRAVRVDPISACASSKSRDRPVYIATDWSDALPVSRHFR